MKRIFCVVGIVLSVCVSTGVLAGTWYVDQSVSESGDGTSWGTALKTIHEGVDAASGGDTVLVADGTYRTGAAGTIDFDGKAITLRSQNGADACIIDCEKAGRGVIFRSGEDHNSVLDGFTITSGRAIFSEPDEYDECGGGIVCDNSSPTIKNCTIRENGAYMDGGGIYCLASSPTITNCTIAANTSEEANGCGIACVQGSNVTISDCIISDNEGSGGDGAVYCRDSIATITDCGFSRNRSGGITCRSSDVTIERCTIANSSPSGIEIREGGSVTVRNCAIFGSHYGGVRCISGSPEIINCTIVGNRSYGILCRNSSPTVLNSIVWANTDGSVLLEEGSTASIRYCDIQGGFEGDGNIEADPSFVALGFWDDSGTPDAEWDDVWVGQDFHLQADSPCIDAGDNAAVPGAIVIDLHGHPRFFDDLNTPDTGSGIAPIVDIGAYEFSGLPSRLYVDASATGANDGTSWADAFTDLQDALNAAAASSGAVHDIWVAAGTYNPDRGTGDPEATFQLLNDVAIYGGFAGGETWLGERGYTANETLLSGDLIGDDGPDFASKDENIHNVVTASGTDATAVLDGFTITGGNADGNSPRKGAGVYNTGGSPIFRNCTITKNTSDYDGSGVYNIENSNPTFINCLISGNVGRAYHDAFGGGMYNYESRPSLTNCAFIGNSGSLGGGMYNYHSDPTLTNCLFSGNLVHEGGGGMRNLGSSPILINCTFSGNWTEGSGGGIENSGSPTLTNCILWGNHDTNPPSELSQISGGTPVINYSCVQGWTGAFGGTGNTGADPLFADADGPDDVVGTEDDNLRLLPGSPCIDAGDNAAVPPTVDTDLDDRPRFIDDPDTPDTGNGAPPIVEMGAYEFDAASPPRLFVDGDATGANNGTSWTDAFRDLQDALNAAAGSSGAVHEIWVAAGTYTPDRETGDREATFQLLSGVAIYGGFAGGETYLEQRDPAANPTVLSGDLNGDDGTLPHWDTAENGYHVVTGSGTNASAVLDGFTITAGNADGPIPEFASGAGMYNWNGSPTVANCAFAGNSAGFSGGGAMCNRDGSNPTVRNCSFLRNQALADWGGGGMCNFGSSPTLTDCTFTGNLGADNGGGLDNWYGSNPMLVNCAFIENRAGTGGGIHAYGECSLTLINCAFTGNTSSTDGGGICVSLDSSAQLVNCLFLNNSASSEGGGAYGSHQSNVTLINCTLINNSAQTGGGAYVWHGSALTLTNSILWGNTASQGSQIAIASTSHPSSADVLYSDVQGGQEDAYIDSGCTLTWGPGNLTAYPLLTADAHLLPTSPCIDAGDNAAVPPSVLIDLDGKPRIVNGTVDMGAFELQGRPWLTITRDDDVVTLQWGEFGDGQYTVEWREDLISGGWQPASGQPLTELMWSDIVSGEVMQRFYRLESAGIYTDPVGFVKVLPVQDGLTMMSVPLIPADNRLNGNPGCIGDIIAEAVAGGPSAQEADTIWKWNRKSQTYQTAYLMAGWGEAHDGHWWDDSTADFSAMRINVGDCFWLWRRPRATTSP